MYQVFHPFTGQDLRSIGPSPYVNLGLGMAAATYADPWKIISRRDRLTPGNTPTGHGVAGLGDDGTSIDLLPAPPPLAGPVDLNIPGGGAVNIANPVAPAYTPPTSTGIPINWNQIIGQAVSSGTQLARLTLTPGGSYSVYNPLTGQTIQYQGTGAPTSTGIPGLTSASALGSWLPLLLIGGVLILVLAKAGG